MKLNSLDVLKEVPELTVVPCVIHAMSKKLEHYQDKILNISTYDNSRHSFEQNLLENNNNYTGQPFKLASVNKPDEIIEFDVNACEVFLEGYENFCEQLTSNLTFENVACSSAAEETLFNVDIMDKDVSSQPNESSYLDSLPECIEYFDMNCAVIKNQNQGVCVAEEYLLTSDCIVASHQDIKYDMHRVTNKTFPDDNETHLNDTSFNDDSIVSSHRDIKYEMHRISEKTFADDNEISINNTSFNNDSIVASYQGIGVHRICDKTFAGENETHLNNKSETNSLNESYYESLHTKNVNFHQECETVKNAKKLLISPRLSCVRQKINLGRNKQNSESYHSASLDSVTKIEIDTDQQKIIKENASINGVVKQPVLQNLIKSQSLNFSASNQIMHNDVQTCSASCLSISDSTDECNSKLGRSLMKLNVKYDNTEPAKHTEEFLVPENCLYQQCNECMFDFNLCKNTDGVIQSCGSVDLSTNNKPDCEFESKSTEILNLNLEQPCVRTAKNSNYSPRICTDRQSVEVQSCVVSQINSMHKSLSAESQHNDVSSYNKKISTIGITEGYIISSPPDRNHCNNVSSNNAKNVKDIYNNEQLNNRRKHMPLPPLRKIICHGKKCSKNKAVSSDHNVELHKDMSKPSSLPPLKLLKSYSSNTSMTTTYRISSETYLKSMAVMYNSENYVKEEANFNYKSSDYLIEEKSGVSFSQNMIEFEKPSGNNGKYCSESSEFSEDESLDDFNVYDLNGRSCMFPYLNGKINVSDNKNHGKRKQTLSKKSIKLPPVLSNTTVCDTKFTMIDSERINTESKTFYGEPCILTELCSEHITAFHTVSSGNFIQTGTKNHGKISRIPVPTSSSVSKNNQCSFRNKSKLLKRDVVGQSFMISKLPVFNKYRSLGSWCGKDKEAYNPFTSAERQMMELLGQDDKTKSISSPVSSSSPNSNKTPPVPSSAPVAEKITTSPVLVTSPKSAFIKFSPIETDSSSQTITDRLSPDHPLDTGSENKSEASNASTPLPDNSEQGSDKNKNPISLSSLSLCSSISIESIDSNKNCLRKGISHSAKSEEKKNESTPLKRSSSVSQSPRSGREFLRTKLRMEDLLYGTNMPVNKNDLFFGSLMDSNNQSQEEINNESSSDSSLHKSLSDAETLNAEQELLKSMTELLYMSSSPPPPRSESPSLKFTPTLISSSQPSEPDSGNQKQSKDEVEPSIYDQSPTIKFCPDSAYNSLNRKSPPDDMSVTTEKDSNSSGSENSFPLSQPPNGAKFCHECGAKYPVAVAKFCCQCGVRRLTI